MKKHEIRIETITSFCLAGIILFFSVGFFINKKVEFSHIFFSELKKWKFYKRFRELSSRSFLK